MKGLEESWCGGWLIMLQTGGGLEGRVSPRVTKGGADPLEIWQTRVLLS